MQFCTQDDARTFPDRYQGVKVLNTGTIQQDIGDASYQVELVCAHQLTAWRSWARCVSLRWSTTCVGVPQYDSGLSY